MNWRGFRKWSRLSCPHMLKREGAWWIGAASVGDDFSWCVLVADGTALAGWTGNCCRLGDVDVWMRIGVPACVSVRWNSDG